MTEMSALPTWQPSIRMLSDDQLDAIHEASLTILAETGIVMKHAGARERLLDAGATEAGDRVRIPAGMVLAAIQSAPSCVPMHTRTGELTMPLEEGRVFFGPGSDCIYTLDIETGERRESVLADVERFARLCDGLENIDFVMSMGTPSDVPTADHYLHSFIAMTRGSVKPNVYTAFDRADMEAIYRIAAAVVGGEDALREKPFLMLYAEPISPLLFNFESVDKLLFCAEVGIPVTYPPSPNTGGGGPITLAGALALGNAETLAGLVLTQLVRPGAPFLYGMNTAALDMKSAIVSYGSPEWAMGMPAWTELGRRYGLPVWGVAGATDSKVVDAQAAAEATVTIMSAYLSRCNLNHDVGYIEYGTTSSMEMIVIADEIIREVRYMVQGIEVSPRTLALDAINRAQPGGGFLADNHTLDNWKWAQWRPDLIDRQRYDRWLAKGAQDMTARARARAASILDTHQPEPLPAEAERVIAEVLAQRQPA